MGYLWAKYEGNHFLDHVPPFTRSLKKGALNVVVNMTSFCFKEWFLFFFLNHAWVCGLYSSVTYTLVLTITVVLRNKKYFVTYFSFHTIKDTANQRTGKLLYVQSYYIQPFHHVPRICCIDCVNWPLYFASNIALGKCTFWLANMLDPFACRLQTHVSLLIRTFARLNKNSGTQGLLV